jgi:hypothetical protein
MAKCLGECFQSVSRKKKKTSERGFLWKGTPTEHKRHGCGGREEEEKSQQEHRMDRMVRMVRILYIDSCLDRYREQSTYRLWTRRRVVRAGSWVISCGRAFSLFPVKSSIASLVSEATISPGSSKMLFQERPRFTKFTSALRHCGTAHRRFPSNESDVRQTRVPNECGRNAN